MLQRSSRCAKTFVVRWHRPLISNPFLRFNSSTPSSSGIEPPQKVDPIQNIDIQEHTVIQHHSTTNELPNNRQLIVFEPPNRQLVVIEPSNRQLMVIEPTQKHKPSRIDTVKFINLELNGITDPNEALKCVRRFLTRHEGEVSGGTIVRCMKKIRRSFSKQPLFHNISNRVARIAMDQLIYHSRFSPHVVPMILYEVISLLKLRDFRMLDTIYSRLERYGKLHQDSFLEKNRYYTKNRVYSPHKDMYYKWILQYAIKQNQLKIGYEFAIKNVKHLKSDKMVIDELVTAFLMKNPLEEEIQLAKVLNLLKLYELKLTEFQANLIFEKVPEEASGFVEKFISKTVRSHLKNEDTDVLLSIGYRSIMKDSSLNNPAGCHETWLNIKHLRNNIAQHEHKILGVLLRVFNKNKKFRRLAMDIANELPRSSYSDPALTGPLIHLSISMKRPQLANAVCSTIKPPISRELLSDLLVMHLSFGDSEGTERVLHQIKEMDSELNARDYMVIISQLLRRNKFDEALKILKTIPLGCAMISYSTMINHFVKQSISQGDTISPDNLAIIDELITKASTVSVDGFWDRLAPMYIKYLVSSGLKADLETAQRIYINTFLDFKAKEYLENHSSLKLNYSLDDTILTTNPFLIEDENQKGLIYLRATDGCKVIILKIIADAAIRIGNVEGLTFALNQLGEAGYTKNEIILDYSRKYRKKASQKGFNPRRLRSYELNDDHRFEDIRENDGLEKLKFLKRFNRKSASKVKQMSDTRFK